VEHERRHRPCSKSGEEQGYAEQFAVVVSRVGPRGVFEALAGDAS
jgi:hypothetical protein